MGNCCSQGNSGDAPNNNNDDDDKGESEDQQDNPAAPPKPSPPIGSTASSKPAKPSPIGPVLGRPMEDVKSTYTIGKELGRGQFGVTHLCTNKVTGQQLPARL
ncbi:hypothetical protein SLE2022_002010 [Rubroshorea leprosula]